MILTTKFGVAGAFSISYLACQDLFPAIYRSIVFEICNLVARSFSILAPMLAEVKDPIPMTVFAIFCILGASSSTFLRSYNSKDK